MNYQDIFIWLIVFKIFKSALLLKNVYLNKKSNESLASQRREVHLSKVYKFVFILVMTRNGFKGINSFCCCFSIKLI